LYRICFVVGVLIIEGLAGARQTIKKFRGGNVMEIRLVNKSGDWPGGFQDGNFGELANAAMIMALLIKLIFYS